jgi:hypothetical protein
MPMKNHHCLISGQEPIYVVMELLPDIETNPALDFVTGGRN